MRSTTADSKAFARLGQPVGAKRVGHWSSMWRVRRPRVAGGRSGCARIVRRLRASAFGHALADERPCASRYPCASMAEILLLPRPPGLRRAPRRASAAARRRHGHAALQPRHAPARLARRAGAEPPRRGQRRAPRVHRGRCRHHRDRLVHVPTAYHLAPLGLADRTGQHQPPSGTAGPRGARGRRRGRARGRLDRPGQLTASRPRPRLAEAAAGVGHRAARERCSRAASTSSSSRRRATSTHLLAAVEAARRLSDLPLVASLTFGEDLSAGRRHRPGDRGRRHCTQAGVDVIGVNCGSGPIAGIDALEADGAGGRRHAAADHAQRRPLRPRRRRVRVGCRAGLLRRGGAGLPGRRRPPHRWLLRHHARAHRGHAPGARPRDARVGPATSATRGRHAVDAPAPAPRPRTASDDKGSRTGAPEAPPPTGLAQQAGRGPLRHQRRDRSAALGAHRAHAGSRPSSSAMPAPTWSTSATAPWPACAWVPWPWASPSSATLGLESLIHFTTRDRNLMALESELLGAHALGIRDILALTGDPPRVGDYPGGTGIWDIDSHRPHRHPAAAEPRRGPGRPAHRRPGRLHHRLRPRPHRRGPRRRARPPGRQDRGRRAPDHDPAHLRDARSGTASWNEPRRAGVTACRGRCSSGVLPLHTARHAEFLHHEVPGITIPDDVRAAMHAAGDRGAEVGLETVAGAARRACARSSTAPTSCPASVATSSRPSWSARACRLPSCAGGSRQRRAALSRPLAMPRCVSLARLRAACSLACAAAAGPGAGRRSTYVPRADGRTSPTRPGSSTASTETHRRGRAARAQRRDRHRHRRLHPEARARWARARTRAGRPRRCWRSGTSAARPAWARSCSGTSTRTIRSPATGVALAMPGPAEELTAIDEVVNTASPVTACEDRRLARRASRRQITLAGPAGHAGHTDGHARATDEPRPLRLRLVCDQQRHAADRRARADGRPALPRAHRQRRRLRLRQGHRPRRHHRASSRMHRHHRGAHRRRDRHLHPVQAGGRLTRRPPSVTPSRSSTSGASAAQGFDDGMVIFFNLTDDRATARCSCTPRRATAPPTSPTSERQAIYEEQMLPFLRECDFDAALLSAMREIDAAATAEHAQATCSWRVRSTPWPGSSWHRCC